MASNRRKRWIKGVRILACGLALWLATRGVHWEDRMVDSGDARQVSAIRTADGAAGQPLATSAAEHVSSITHQQETNKALDGHAGQGGMRIEYGLRTGWQQSSKALMLLAVGIFSLVPLLQGCRLKWLLGAEGIVIGLWQGIKLSLAGNFLNFAAPLGSTAGDVGKAYYVAQYAPKRKTEAATIVLLDRALGLFCLLSVVALIAALSPEGSRFAPLRSYTLGALALVVGGSICLLSKTVRRMVLPSCLIERLPMIDRLRRAVGTMRRVMRQKRVLAGAVSATVVLQVLAAAAFVATAAALGMRTEAAASLPYFAAFSAGEIVKALPGPPQGLGTAELAYQYFFGPYGSASQIVCAAFGMRLVMLICALPGLAVVMSGAQKPRPATSTSNGRADARPAWSVVT